MEQYNNSLLILEDKKTMTHDELSTKWKDFQEKFPKLYMLLTTSPDFDLQMLKYLCQNVEKHKKMNDDDKLNLEVSVGKKLADKYIYKQTNLPKPTPQQELFIKERIKEKLNKENSEQEMQERIQEQFKNQN